MFSSCALSRSKKEFGDCAHTVDTEVKVDWKRKVSHCTAKSQLCFAVEFFAGNTDAAVQSCAKL